MSATSSGGGLGLAAPHGSASDLNEAVAPPIEVRRPGYRPSPSASASGWKASERPRVPGKTLEAAYLRGYASSATGARPMGRRRLIPSAALSEEATIRADRDPPSP